MKTASYSRMTKLLKGILVLVKVDPLLDECGNGHRNWNHKTLLLLLVLESFTGRVEDGKSTSSSLNLLASCLNYLHKFLTWFLLTS